jgi:hypothetical protein
LLLARWAGEWESKSFLDLTRSFADYADQTVGIAPRPDVPEVPLLAELL